MCRSCLCVQICATCAICTVFLRLVSFLPAHYVKNVSWKKHVHYVAEFEHSPDFVSNTSVTTTPMAAYLSPTDLFIRYITVVPKGPLLSNMSHLGTTDIIVFSGICFGTYFTIQIILIPIYIGIQYIVFQSCPSRARDCSITDNN